MVPVVAQCKPQATYQQMQSQHVDSATTCDARLFGDAHKHELAPRVDRHRRESIVRGTELLDALQPRRLPQPAVQRCTTNPS